MIQKFHRKNNYYNKFKFEKNKNFQTIQTFFFNGNAYFNKSGADDITQKYRFDNKGCVSKNKIDYLSLSNGLKCKKRLHDYQKLHQNKEIKINAKKNAKAKGTRKINRKNIRKGQLSSESAKIKILEMPDSGYNIPDLASKLNCTTADVVKILFMKGITPKLTSN